MKATLELNLTWKFEAFVSTHGKMAGFEFFWKTGQNWVLIRRFLQIPKCQIFHFNLLRNMCWNQKGTGKFRLRIPWRNKIRGFMDICRRFLFLDSLFIMTWIFKGLKLSLKRTFLMNVVHLYLFFNYSVYSHN